jgi:hypothetical protein
MRRTLATALALATLAFLLAVSMGPQRIGEAIGREDQLIEYLTALLFFLGAVVAGRAFLAGRHRIWSAFWCVFCFFCMGEEVSWFQRVLGFSVPAVEGYSGQSEFNLHNLRIFRGGRVIAADGGFDLSLDMLLNSQNLFRLGLVAWFLVLPALTLLPAIRRLADRFDYVRPSLVLLAPLWLVLAFATILTVTTMPPVKDYVAEATEFGYAAMALVYTLLLARSPSPADARPGVG